MNQIPTQVEIENEATEAVTIVAEQKVIDCNEQACEMVGLDRSNFIGTDSNSYIVGEKVESGRKVEQLITGQTEKETLQIERTDGSIIEIEMKANLFTINGTEYIKCRSELLEEIEPPVESPKKKSLFESEEEVFNLSDDELRERVKAIRVETPDGPMPLQAIVLDLAVGHNEVEQYKQGALALNQALEQRIKEERKEDPESITIEILREVKRSAFGLYLRLQRGDEELHGHRDGLYSGYFE
jgi:PAS domain S-box-containing protein